MAAKRFIKPGGTRGTLFKEVARHRLEDAAALLNQERYAGAIYLAGYALECLLKWAVTRRASLVYLPAAFETHDLDKLLMEAGLDTALKREIALHAAYSSVADRWGPGLRYLARAPN